MPRGEVAKVSGIYSLFGEIPMDRVYFLNPGESIDVGDRLLTAVKPPTFDNPATTGLYDGKSRAYFSSDSFGAVVNIGTGVQASTEELVATAEEAPDA